MRDGDEMSPYDLSSTRDGTCLALTENVHSRLTVLVIDDDPDVRDVLSALLTKAGYDVEVASDGAEAIDALTRAEVPPDAILTDLEMPRLMGDSVVAFVQSEERLSRIPIAVLSGAPELAPLGVPVFEKPVKASTLLAYLSSKLE